MLFLRRFLTFALIVTVFFTCQPKILKKPALAGKTAFRLPDSALVTVPRENVRQKPNGKILGTLRKGQKIFIDKRLGNWLLFHNRRFDHAYIWAPSAGFQYINLYNPATYFDSTRNQFYPVDYFRRLFGDPGLLRQELSTEQQLFFDQIGLGSHEEVVMDVVTETTQNIRHGITLYIDTRTDAVRQVRIDFFRLVKGTSAALRKCGLPFRDPSESNEGHVVWRVGEIFPGLKIDLERKEWESDWFRSVRFRENDMGK